MFTARDMKNGRRDNAAQERLRELGDEAFTEYEERAPIASENVRRPERIHCPARSSGHVVWLATPDNAGGSMTFRFAVASPCPPADTVTAS